jgi:glycosyltransferase involved in cell wall biosynthesis
VEAPLPWTVAREEREYGLADCIVVNSSFAYATFVAEGVPPDKLGKMVAGANLLAFRATPAAVEDRCRRIQAGAPLHVLTVGTFSLRKGMWDMAAAIRALDGNRFRFRFVGPIAPDAAALVPHMHSVTFTPKQPQAELVPIYAAGDLFALPTIEDGFPAVLGQAAAAALPILTTPNGAGYDLVRDGSTGWVLPIRDPQAFVDQLRWCDTHRDALAEMVQQSYHQYQPRSWGAAAADLEAIYYKHRDSLNRRKSVDH